MSKILKAIGNVGKGIGKSLVKDFLPIPSLKDASKNIDLKKLADSLRKKDLSSVRTQAKFQGKELEEYIADILDDGKINNSYDDEKLENISRMVTGASGFIALIIYLITQIL